MWPWFFVKNVTVHRVVNGLTGDYESRTDSNNPIYADLSWRIGYKSVLKSYVKKNLK